MSQHDLLTLVSAACSAGCALSMYLETRNIKVAWAVVLALGAICTAIEAARF